MNVAVLSARSRYSLHYWAHFDFHKWLHYGSHLAWVQEEQSADSMGDEFDSEANSEANSEEPVVRGSASRQLMSDSFSDKVTAWGAHCALLILGSGGEPW